MNTEPMKNVTMNQNRSRSTSPRSAANTPSWQVTLESTRMIVNGAAVFRSRTTSFGGQFGSFTARTVKYIANSAAKNISSEDSQTIMPTLTRLGRFSDPCDGSCSISGSGGHGGILPVAGSGCRVTPVGASRSGLDVDYDQPVMAPDYARRCATIGAWPTRPRARSTVLVYSSHDATRARLITALGTAARRPASS